MDAGKFSNFNIGSVGGHKPNVKKSEDLPKKLPNIEVDPKESVQLGGLAGHQLGLGGLLGSLNETQLESIGLPVDELKTNAQEAPKSAPSSIPMEIDGLLLAGVNSTGHVSKPSLGDLTALNSIGSPTLTTLDGKTLASVSPLQPITETKMPTTSISLLNGLESEFFVTTSGRQIAL